MSDEIKKLLENIDQFDIDVADEEEKENLSIITTEEAEEQLALISQTNELNPMDYRLLNYMALGHTQTEACRKFKRSKKYISALVKKEVAQLYTLYLTEGFKEKCFAKKEDVIRDLAIRLQTATNKDAIGLAKTIASLAGWTENEKSTKVEININWGDDPWSSPARDIEYEEVEDIDDDEN